MSRSLILWTALGVLLTSPLMVASQEAKDADTGEALFLAYQCWQCHGYEGHGGVAPRVALITYPFEAFSVFVRYTSLMPAYSPNNLSDEHLRKIYDYLISIAEPPSLEDIAALRDL